MADFSFVPDTRTTPITVDSALVYNQLCSLCLLTQQHLDHISPWVDRTLGQITERERALAELACGAAMFVAPTGARTIEELIGGLRSLEPGVVVARMTGMMLTKARNEFDDEELPDAARLTTDRDTFVALFNRLRTAHDKEFDPLQAEDEFEKLQRPAEYRDRLAYAVEHLWTTYLREEWPNVEPTIRAAVSAFRSVRIPGSNMEERLRYVTGRDSIPDDFVDSATRADEVIYIPSVHIGPYMILFEYDGRRAVIVGPVRNPEGSTVHTPTLDRSELLMRLDALSDGTRLAMLALAAEQGEITTQDTMDALELSQSSASRHLTQLAATGLLTVDASERTKRYRVNPRRIETVCDGLRSLTTPRSGHGPGGT